jgi:hypothetical protein
MQAEQRDGIGCAFAPVETAWIDLVFFCGVASVLAVLSAVLGPYVAIMGGAGATVYVLSFAIAPWCLTGLVTQWVSNRAGRRLPLWLVAAIGTIAAGHETLGWEKFAPRTAEAGREDRFQLSGAEWTAEDDALLRVLIGSGRPPRVIALEMKRTVGGIRARTAKLGLRNNRLGDTSAG